MRVDNQHEKGKVILRVSGCEVGRCLPTNPARNGRMTGAKLLTDELKVKNGTGKSRQTLSPHVSAMGFQLILSGSYQRQVTEMQECIHFISRFHFIIALALLRPIWPKWFTFPLTTAFR